MIPTPPDGDLGEWALEPEQARMFEHLRDTMLTQHPGLAPVFLHADGTLRVVFCYGWMLGELRQLQGAPPPTTTLREVLDELYAEHPAEAETEHPG